MLKFSTLLHSTLSALRYPHTFACYISAALHPHRKPSLPPSPLRYIRIYRHSAQHCDISPFRDVKAVHHCKYLVIFSFFFSENCFFRIRNAVYCNTVAAANLTYPHWSPMGHHILFVWYSGKLWYPIFLCCIILGMISTSSSG